jgi:hypothetical protein
MSRSRFLYGLEKTPDNRLNWSPGGEARTPLQLAGRMAFFAGHMAHRIQHPAGPEMQGGPPPSPQTRAEAMAAVGEAFDRLRAAIAGLSEADLEQKMPFPYGGPVPVGHILWWLSGVLAYQQGQLNYAQMAYGDADANIPPNWGQEEG